MAAGRIYRAATESVASSKGRIYRAESAGGGTATPKGRIYRAEAAGIAAVTLLPIANITAEPGTVVPITAVLEGGGSADSYTWRRVSGPASTLSTAGGVASLTVPALAVNYIPVQAVVVIGVTATKSGTTSREVTTTITGLPETDWSRIPGGAWVGATR